MLSDQENTYSFPSLDFLYSCVKAYTGNKDKQNILKVLFFVDAGWNLHKDIVEDRGK